jgi:hypothetical protein
LKEIASQGNSFRMGNSTFGVDPDQGHVKTLRIYARGSNGQTRTFEYREGSTVDGSQFSGWSGGNWGNGGWNGGWGNGGNNGGWNGGNNGGNGGWNGGNGQYQILSARYGTANHNVDVTQRLKEIASKGNSSSQSRNRRSSRRRASR